MRTQVLAYNEARGRTPYGASTIAGDKGELQPKPEDLRVAQILGHHVAQVTVQVRGQKA